MKQLNTPLKYAWPFTFLFFVHTQLAIISAVALHLCWSARRQSCPACVRPHVHVPVPGCQRSGGGREGSALSWLAQPTPVLKTREARGSLTGGDGQGQDDVGCAGRQAS